MAPHSSTLAWKIPWTEEPGGLQPMESLRLGHDFTFTFTFHFHALEKEMATHSSILAWRIPRTKEPGRIQSMGSQRLRHDCDFSLFCHSISATICFSFWLTSLSMIISRSIHINCKWHYFTLFYGWIVFHCVYTSHLLYPFIWSMDI